MSLKKKMKQILMNELDILKQRRRELNIKQKTISSKINRSNSWYSKLEHGVIKKIDVWVFNKICLELKLNENLVKFE